MSLNINIVYVTYDLPDIFKRNISLTRSVFPGSNIIVVDNSDIYNEEIKTYTLQSESKYIRSKINNRFSAYNLSVSYLTSELTIFRTDDDVFDEAKLRNVIKRVDSDMVITPYTYDGKINTDLSYMRPLESVIFSTNFLRSLLPFDNVSSSDWNLLRKAYELTKPKFIKEVVLHKEPHGRP